MPEPNTQQSAVYTIWGQIEAQPLNGEGESANVSEPEPLVRFTSLEAARRYLLALSCDPEHSPLWQDLKRED